MSGQSPLTWTFVRDIQPLPVSDRRLLLREMRVDGVDHRNDESFYGWLADRYRQHELVEVDQALRRCCAKAEQRMAIRSLTNWLFRESGRRPDPDGEPEQGFHAMVLQVRATSDENAAIIDALAPYFQRPEERETSAPPESVEPLDAAAVLARLEAAIKQLATEPSFDLLLRADAFASDIEEHYARLQDGAARQALARRLAAALAQLPPEDAAAVGDALVAALDVEVLEQLLAAAEAFAAAQSAWEDAEVRCRELPAPSDGPRKIVAVTPTMRGRKPARVGAR